MATEAIVSFAIQAFGNLLTEETKSVYGVGDKLKELQSTLQTVRAFLKDAEARRHEKAGVNDWIAQIREAAYDAEDVLETYVLEVKLKRRGGVKGALKRLAGLPNKALTLHKIGKDVDEITSRLSKIAENSKALGIREAMAGEQSDSWQARLREQRKTFPHVVDHDLVGMERSIEELVTYLVDEENKFLVLSICGMGGLGKTTLARKVYQHGKVRNHFEHFAWAYISQQCQRRVTWEGIWKSLSSKSSAEMQDEELAKQLHEFLSNEKCLVVLDDIWTTRTWDYLKVAFPKNTRSKILLTSRNRNVALHADRARSPYQPQFLGNEESWKLLQKIVFPGRNEDSDFKIEEKMEELGKDMIRKCGGLPLAVRVLGGLLAKSCTLNRWQMIHNSIGSYITLGIEQEEKDSLVHGLLSLSYGELPSQLKNCFLYLALFPEDHEIPVRKLMKLWIAEGFINVLQYDGRQPRRMEDVAELSLDELIDRSMVLIGRTDVASSRVVTCRLHDVMRDFCLLKAKEECFLQVIDSKDQDVNADASSSAPSSSGTCRRVTVHLSEDKIFQQDLIRNHLLRSLIYVSPVGYWRLSKASFKNLKVLRVLDLERVRIRRRKPLRDIGELVHLRYLSLLDAELEEIPSSLGNLRLLETLDLRIFGEVYVPNVLKKMKRLRHLYLPLFMKVKTKLELGNLKELQTLVNFQFPGVCDARDLLSLTKLETLTVLQIGETKAEMMSPTTWGYALKNLQSFTYKDFPSGRDHPSQDVRDLVSGLTNLSKLVLDLKIEKLPDSSQMPPGITRLILHTCELEEDPMPVLERLQMLRALEIEGCAFKGKEMVCSRDGFPQLRRLMLEGLPNLEEWKLGEGAMPHLHSLGIVLCSKLKALPEALKGIESLRELEFRLMPKRFKEKVVQGGEDFYKIRHVPSVLFYHCDRE